MLVPAPTVCRDNPDWLVEWYPAPIPEHVSTGCASCYFRLDCLKSAIEFQATTGVWAGHDFSNIEIRRTMGRKKTKKRR